MSEGLVGAMTDATTAAPRAPTLTWRATRRAATYSTAWAAAAATTTTNGRRTTGAAAARTTDGTEMGTAGRGLTRTRTVAGEVGRRGLAVGTMAQLVAMVVVVL